MFRFGTFHQSSCIRKFLTSSNLHQHSCVVVTALPALLVSAPGFPWGWWQGQAILPLSCSPLPPAWLSCSVPGMVGWFWCLNGVGNAGCLLPQLSPRSLSTHTVASPKTDSHLTWEKTALNFVSTLESEILMELERMLPIGRKGKSRRF